MTLAQLQEQKAAERKIQVRKETQRQYNTLIIEIENMGKSGLTVGTTWNAKVDRATELQDKLQALR